MAILMSDASLTLFERVLTSLSNVLAKAEAHAQAQRIEPAALLQARLFPNMFPLTSQVQFSCDFAKGAAARLSGVEVPSFADVEQTFGQLQERIARTLTFIRSADRAAIDGSQDRVIAFNFAGQPLRFKGQAYLLGFVIPSLLFHASTAYALLRHSGVAVGKADFLGPLDLL